MKKIFSFLIILFVLICSLSCTEEKKEDNPTEDQIYFKSVYKYLDDEKSVFVRVDYNKLQEIIDSKETVIIMFGGSWCPNCQAIVKFVNEMAKKMYIDEIYCFDTKIDFDGEVRDIRRCNTESDTKMWSSIVNKIGFSSGNTVKKEDVEVLDEDGLTLSTMPVPTLVVLKDGKVANDGDKKVGQLTEELFYNPDTNTLWDSMTFDGSDVTESFKTKLVSLFTVYDGCSNEECSE